MKKYIKQLWNYSTKNTKAQNMLSYLYNVIGRNHRKIKGKNTIIKTGAFLKEIVFDIEGNNNVIILKRGAVVRNTTFLIRGNNNTIILEEYCRYNGGSLWIEDSFAQIIIESKTTVEEAHLACTENNSEIHLGKDCMLAKGIEIRTGDSHSIIDISSGKRINFAKNVLLKDHVWIGSRAMILKGVIIEEHSVVAAGSVVTKSMPSHVLIGGVPAQVIKTGITWERERIRN